MDVKELEDLLRRHRAVMAQAQAVVDEARRIRAARSEERKAARLRGMALSEQTALRIERANTALSKSGDADDHVREVPEQDKGPAA